MLFFRKRAEMPAPDQILPGRPMPLPTAERHFVNGHPLKGPYPDGIETVVFGLGCFWGRSASSGSSATASSSRRWAMPPAPPRTRPTRRCAPG